MYPRAFIQPEGAIETPVEIAVVKIPSPVNVDKGLAHHGPDILIAMGAPKQIHIFVELPQGYQMKAKPLDRHICDGEKTVENDAMAFTQFSPVFFLQFRLRRGEKRA
jgi:hypothetical protein